MTKPRVRIQRLTDEMHEWLLKQPRGMMHLGFSDKCGWCGHDWHTIKCNTCRCTNSRERLDDTWRPRLTAPGHQDYARIISHDTGADGWAATAATGLIRPNQINPSVIKKYLYGS